MFIITCSDNTENNIESKTISILDFYKLKKIIYEITKSPKDSQLKS